LFGPCRRDSLANSDGGFGWSILAQFGYHYGGDFEVDIQSIEEWAGETSSIPLDLLGRAMAFTSAIAVVPARAWIHGRDQHQLRGIAECGIDSGYGDGAFFERLAKAIEDLPPKLQHFIEKEDAMMGE